MGKKTPNMQASQSIRKRKSSEDSTSSWRSPNAILPPKWDSRRRSSTRHAPLIAQTWGLAKAHISCYPLSYPSNRYLQLGYVQWQDIWPSGAGTSQAYLMCYWSHQGENPKRHSRSKINKNQGNRQRTLQTLKRVSSLIGLQRLAHKRKLLSENFTFLPFY